MSHGQPTSISADERAAASAATSDSPPPMALRRWCAVQYRSAFFCNQSVSSNGTSERVGSVSINFTHSEEFLRTSRCPDSSSLRRHTHSATFVSTSGAQVPFPETNAVALVVLLELPTATLPVVVAFVEFCTKRPPSKSTVFPANCMLPEVSGKLHSSGDRS